MHTYKTEETFTASLVYRVTYWIPLDLLSACFYHLLESKNPKHFRFVDWAFPWLWHWCM